MIEGYSNNISVGSNALVPLNTVFRKGTTVTKSGDATLALNKCGIYEVAVNATGVANTGGIMTLQLMVNGAAVPNAFASVTAADTTSTHPLAFTTKVQVPTTYRECCPCSPAFDIKVLNAGVDATYSLVNVLVTKLV